MLLHPPNLTAGEARRGVVLLVVISLLTIFAAAGIAFVYYADAEATSSKYFREATALRPPEEDPEALLAYFLQQLLYDVKDDESGVYSAMRGHSLMRSMFGMDYQYNTAGGITLVNNTAPWNGVGRMHTPTTWPPPRPPASPPVPFSPFADNLRYVGPIFAIPPAEAKDDFFLVNYTYFPPLTANDRVPDANGRLTGFLRDPERPGFRSGLRAPNAADNRWPFTGGYNVPYTYPDLNNMFLAAVKADGTLIAPSFHRDYTGFNKIGATTYTGLDPANPNWYADPQGKLRPWLKYMVLRPRPEDHPDVTVNGVVKKGFPPPEDSGGDVQNAVGWTKGNDSFWMDLGAPIFTLPDGRRVRPLFATLIVDLDSKINVNVHGNIRGTGQDHVFNQGWTPSEVSLRQVLTADSPPVEWKNLFVGRNTGLPPNPLHLVGRYGPDGRPNTAANVAMPTAIQPPPPIPPWPPAVKPTPYPWAAPSRAPHVYAQTDFDASDNSGGTTGKATAALSLPATTASAFPTYPTGYQNGTANECKDHPALYNAYLPQKWLNPVTRQWEYDRRFPASDMEVLLRQNDVGVEALTSDLLQLCPGNFSAAGNPVRGRVTTDSYDLDVPGVPPWIYDPANSGSYSVALGSIGAPTGGAVAFPNWNLRNKTVNPLPPPPKPYTLPKGSDFGTAGVNPLPFPRTPPTFNSVDTIDWRGINAALGRIDLNRMLTQYPLYNAQGRQTTATFNMRFDETANALQAAQQQQFLQAQADRQQFANDIYRRLLVATAVPAPANVRAPTDAELAPRRWLAQLAANIVDYIDEDDISTPFNFYTTADGLDPGSNGLTVQIGTDAVPRYWVFGTELPKVVLNEVLAETQNPAGPGAGTVKLWLELLNPIPAQQVPATGVQAQDAFPAMLKVNAGTNPARFPAYAPYRIIVSSGMPSRPFNDNVLGAPTNARVDTQPTAAGPNDVFAATATRVRTGNQPQFAAGVPSPYIPPYNPAPANAPQGFFLLGPPSAVNAGQPDPFVAQNPLNPKAVKGTVPDNTPVIHHNRFQLIPRTAADLTNGLTVVLRRLANPHLPFSGNPLLPNRQVNPFYNPYITMDYVEKVPLRYGPTGGVGGIGGSPGSPGGFASRGKKQPYTAFTDVNLKTLPAGGTIPDVYSPKLATSQVTDQGTASKQGVNHTFGQPNDNSPRAYDWLVHLDRQVISTMELLHVSGYQPYQLTQRFINLDSSNNSAKFQHLAPWFDESTRIFRALEFLGTHSYTAGTGQFPGSRWAGKVNINTIWDSEIFAALDGGTLTFANIVQSRTPNLSSALPPVGLTVNDKPFRSLATPISAGGAGDLQYPNGLGIKDTILRPNSPTGTATTQRLLGSGATTDHPYSQYLTLTKIYNNLTTRSNVFAVWVTVGFFEVNQEITTTDQNGVPVRVVSLGQEVGRTEGRNIRHRMFAVVDRSNLQKFVWQTPAAGLKGATAVATTGSQVARPTRMTATTTDGYTFNITVGTVLRIDAGTAQEENVMVTATTAANFTANFTKTHAAGYTIDVYGNPLPPLTPFNPHANPELVPHFSIIE